MFRHIVTIIRYTIYNSFLLKVLYIICLLGILYITLLAENYQKLKMATIGRNM